MPLFNHAQLSFLFEIASPVMRKAQSGFLLRSMILILVVLGALKVDNVTGNKGSGSLLLVV